MAEKQFRASWWLPGGHAQTLWPALMRRVRLDVRSELLELPDGDVVRLDWVGNSGPIVIVLPGLQGDLDSAYVRGLLLACKQRGWRGVLLNYRGRGEPNRLRQSYHCGMTCDLDYLVHFLSQQEPGTPIGVVGCSVGANICLKWLGECGQRGQSVPVAAAVGVSAPFQLGAVVKKIERGFSRVYQWYLLRSLRRDVVRKMEIWGDDLGITRRELRRLNTFFKFDDRISGPWNGFKGADDYYAKTRSDVLLKHVTVPTLILNARNDPLVPIELIPHHRHLSDQVTLEITDGGGHLGFVSGRWPWSPCFWLEERVPDFLAGFF
jgi:predicted alpha/beta-fold hydrolase